MALTNMKVKMVDLDGQYSSSTFHMAAGADPATQTSLQTALDGISSSGITGIQAAYHDNTPGADAAPSVYGSASDKLELEFQGAQGSLVKVSIAAPAAECFTANGETIDMTFCGAAIAAIAANTVDTNGGAVTFLKGRRVWKRRKKA